MLHVLGVFAKWPQVGQVKTRLAASIGTEAAAQLYEAFLKDFLPRIERVPAHLVLAYTPTEAKSYFRSLVSDRFRLAAQADGDLGTRMRVFMEHEFDRGATVVVLVGSDAPDLPIDRIEQAFSELEHGDIVLGPCADGGYYLVGTSRPIPELFTEINWGTVDVFGQTVQRINELGAHLIKLEPWSDVDTGGDLIELAARISAHHRVGNDVTLPHTAALLHQFL